MASENENGNGKSRKAKRKYSPAENRLILQMLTYWKAMCGDRAFPSLVDVNPSDISDIWPQCFVLDVSGSTESPIFHYIGKSLDADRQIDLALVSGKPALDDDLFRATPTSLGQAAKNFRQVLSKKSPVSTSGVFEHPNGKTILYRSILLPLSDDQKTFNYLLGAVSSRRVASDTISIYEVQTEQRGGPWHVDFVSDEKDTSLSVARRRYESGDYASVRVVEEIHDPTIRLTNSRIIFEKPGARDEDRKARS